MIQVRYAPDLIEQAVWLAVRREAATEAELHASIDPIFERPDGEDRDALFQAAFVDWLTRLRLDRFLDETLSLFPMVVERVERAVVRSAPRRKAEGAELFVRTGCGAVHRTLVVQLRPESLVDPQTVRDSLLRELQHVEDMLDADFAYEPESIEGLPSRQQIVRDRYRALWEIRVEATLVRRNLLDRPLESLVQARFEKAFTVASAVPPPTAYRRIWDGDLAHAELLALAKDPKLLHGTGGGEGCTTSLGEPCPVCGFPTFDWYPMPSEPREAFVVRIRDVCGGWTPRSGICRQCAETFDPAGVEASCV